MGQQGRERRGGGRGGGQSRDVQVSKALSLLLRHAAEKEGVKMNAQGYANVADVVSSHQLQNSLWNLKNHVNSRRSRCSLPGESSSPSKLPLTKSNTPSARPTRNASPSSTFPPHNHPNPQQKQPQHLQQHPGLRNQRTVKSRRAATSPRRRCLRHRQATRTKRMRHSRLWRPQMLIHPTT